MITKQEGGAPPSIPNVIDLPGEAVLTGAVHPGMRVRCITDDGREHIGFIRETHLRPNGDAGYSVSYSRHPDRKGD